MLTKFERETIINFNEEETIAYVFTYNRRWQTWIENKLGVKPYEINSFGGKWYKLLKKQISKPRQLKVKKVMTDEQRDVIRTRFKKSLGR
jgi:hypothetical protein